MLDSLKHLYKENMIQDLDETSSPKMYAWFTDKSGNHFGIKNDCIGEKEQKLLELFFQPILPPVQSLSKRETFWQSILFNDDMALASTKTVDVFQFIYFYIKQQDFDVLTFSELLREFFDSDISIIWQDGKSGFIVKEGGTDPNFHEIIDTITTEILVDFSVFIGSKQYDLQTAKKIFQIETKLFRTASMKYPKQRLYTSEQIYPVILTQQLDTDMQTYFTDCLLKEVKDDLELIHTIKVYLESNMNLTLAAKKLFIHRNSLQYRVDKFIEKTGIDVKQFENAVSVYLSLLSK